VKSASNETLQTIKQRRSVQLFMKEEAPDEDINLLFDAASEAPSAHNQQSWKFFVSSISSWMKFLISWETPRENSWASFLSAQPPLPAAVPKNNLW